MARRTLRYDPKTKTMVDVTYEQTNEAAFVRDDVPAFVSPLDGSVVEGAKAYREHMKKHNVVPFEAGSEKASPKQPDPKPRRELIWELADRMTRGRPVRG